MHRFSSVLFAGILVAFATGCESSPEATAPSPSPSPVAEKKPPAKAAAAPVAPPPIAKGTTTVALIQSTNPKERAKQVGKGRTDPFAGLDLPRITVKLPAPPVKPVQRVPSVGTLPSLASNPGSRGGGASGSSRLIGLPPLPEPELAKAVKVSGVVRLGNMVQAIVKAPDEPTARYVSEGQRLSNGQVLVKRIEVGDGSEATVILEQYGVEVTRGVGDKPEAAPAPAAPGLPATTPPV